MVDDKRPVPEKQTSKENRLSETYIAFRIPDKMRIALIIDEARGKRTMTQFAQVCGVSPSTFSRLVNEKITRPMSLNLIRKVAENGNKKSEQLFEELALANGYIKKDDYEAIGRFTGVYLQAIPDYGRRMRNIVMTELLQRGIQVRLLEHQMTKIDAKYSAGLKYTFQIETDLGYGHIFWSFFAIEHEIGDPEHEVYLSGDLGEGFVGSTYEVLQNLSQWGLLDLVEPELLKGRMHTILIPNNAAFCERILKVSDSKEVNTDLSLISIDMEMERINFEAYLKRKDGKKHELIFNRPVIDV